MAILWPTSKTVFLLSRYLPVLKQENEVSTAFWSKLFLLLSGESVLTSITWLEIKIVPDSVSPKLRAPERVRFEIDPGEIFRVDTDQDTDKEGKCTCLN